MFLLSFWNVFTFFVKCFYFLCEMFLISLWNVSTFFLKCFYFLCEKFLISLWNVSTFFLKCFYYNKDTAKYDIKTWINLHVKSPLFLLGFNVSWGFWTEFRLHSNQISWKSVKWEPICSVRTDRIDKVNSRFSHDFNHT